MENYGFDKVYLQEVTVPHWVRGAKETAFILVDQFQIGGAGTDIGPLKDKVPGVVLIGFEPDSQRYFDVHHSPNDVFEM